LAREVGVRGITVNAVAPGFIQTDMTDALPEDQKNELTAQIPMGRLGTVNEVAQAVLFLAGDSGAYITAQTLHVNGGMYTV
jgi:3-oxoacyl-[acyl-carrier protein] reductase